MQQVYKKVLGFIVILFFTKTIQSQHFYYVSFKDKTGTAYTIDQPEKFLSPRAIEKRQRFHIPITEEDLPVSEPYIKQLLSLDSRSYIHSKSKWLNGVTIAVYDSTFENKAQKLSFVNNVELTHIEKDTTYEYIRPSIIYDENANNTIMEDARKLDYGSGQYQIEQLNLHFLHMMGYRGKGIVMAMHDGGFLNSDSITFFDNLRNSGRLLGSRNFSNPDISVFEEGDHGTLCFSTIASDKKYYLIGTAPDVSAYLLKTENNETETPIEEDNWVAALEYDDSLGVDVVNSSLGYTNFDSLPGLQKRTYQFQDGKTSRASIAASKAASKGIIVCNSNGNEGNDKWHYMGFPADAPNILSVGAVDYQGRRAFFSSFGPTADGRIKPDICALGLNTACVNPENLLDFASGTSLSSPVLAGGVICLWQAFPEKTTYQIMEAIRYSGSNAAQPNNPIDSIRLKNDNDIQPAKVYGGIRYHNSPGIQPNNSLGYGVANFLKAYNILKYGLPQIIENGQEQIRLDIKSFVINAYKKTFKMGEDKFVRSTKKKYIVMHISSVTKIKADREMTFKITSDNKRKVDIQISDNQNKILVRKKLFIDQGQNTYKLKIPELSQSNVLTFNLKYGEKTITQIIGYQKTGSNKDKGTYYENDEDGDGYDY